jgi:hypothetical protein
MKTLILTSLTALGLALSINAASALPGDNNAEQANAIWSVRTAPVTVGAGKTFYASSRTLVNDHSGERVMDNGVATKGDRSFYAVEKTLVNDHSGNIVR